MRKIVHFIALLLAVVLITIGCTNLQSSSKEEAKYVVFSLPDCEKIIQYLNISSGRATFGDAKDPFLLDSDPKIAEGNPVIIHEIIYKKKGEEKYALVLLDDDRPPKIVKNINIGGDPPKK